MPFEAWSSDGACGPAAPAAAVVTHLAVAPRVTFGEPTLAITVRVQTDPDTLTVGADVLLLAADGAPVALVHLPEAPVGAGDTALEGAATIAAPAQIAAAWVWLTTTREVPVAATLVHGALRQDRGHPTADLVIQLAVGDADPGSVAVTARWTTAGGGVVSEAPIPIGTSSAPPRGAPLVQARLILPANADLAHLRLQLQARATRRDTWAPPAPEGLLVVQRPPPAPAEAPPPAAAPAGPWDLISAGRVDEALALFAQGDAGDADARVASLLTAADVDRILLGCRLAGVLRPKNAYGPLLHLLRHADPTVRTAAVQAVTALGNLGAVPQLNVLKHDPDAGVRAAVEASLASMRRR